MHRRRRAALLPILAILAIAGCTPTPTPEPTTAHPSTEPTTQAPTVEPAVAPEVAFDLPCDDVQHGMIELFGIPSAPVTERLRLEESPNWYPGPAQYMFRRAGGVVCAYDDGEAAWQLTATPHAQAILDDLDANGYTDHEQSSQCNPGRCTLVVRAGDVLIEATLQDPALTEADLDRTREIVVALAQQAEASATEVEVVPSAIAGVRCDQILPAEELAAAWDVPAQIQSEFGGWGVPASVYWNVDGAMACIYNERPGDYEGEYYLTLTTLPDGRWASTLPQGRTAVEVDGADAAYSGEDDYYEDLPFVDVVVGDDWVRISAPGRSIEEALLVAPLIAAHMTGLGS